MIDMTKQYSYKGRPVRIYADGSDLVSNTHIHGAFLNDDGKWSLLNCHHCELVEVWQPKEGDICLFWDNCSNNMVVDIFIKMSKGNRFFDKDNISWDNCAPFVGVLPEAFKGF